MKDFVNIPEELKIDGLWCAWKLTEKGKEPFNTANDRHAKSNDKSTFNSYFSVLKALDRYYKVDEKGKQLGGLGLGVFNGFSAIDIDHCVENGILSPLAIEIIKYCNSYTELSPSGTGVRIIFKTNTKIDKENYYINNAKLGVEIYISDNTNKFVSITGNKISTTNAVNNVDLTELINKYMKKQNNAITPVNVRKINISIDEAINKDKKLNKLWNSVAPGSHANESELDASLCCKLAFYLNNDINAIKQAFEQSPYYLSKDEVHKRKWNTVYSVNTIKGALRYANANNKTYALNDVGNAHRFANKFHNNVRYNIDNEMWMLWNKRFWEYDVKGKIRDFVDLLAKDMCEELKNEEDETKRKLIASNINKIQNNAGKKALLEECEHIDDIPVLNSDFDKDKYIICANNMMFDLQNGTPIDFDRNYMISQTITCDIDLEHEPTRWLKFLDEIFEGDKEMINYTRKVLAYALSGSTREQCMWIFYGDGNNGKSLMLEILNELMGSYGITARPELLVDARNANTSQEEIARLKGKRAIFMEEIKDGDRMNESLVKQLTSGVGKMTGRFLYGNTFELTVIGKILMASNYKPKIKGIDKGIWRRIKLVPLNRDFTAVADKDLRDKLIAELPQIAGWLCKGFKLYIDEGLNEPRKVFEQTKEYKEESDIVQTWVNENCEIGAPATHWCKASELFEDFVLWCKKNQENILTQTAFGRNMGKKFKRLSYSTGKVYVGVKLRPIPEDIKRKVQYDIIDIDKEKI